MKEEAKIKDRGRMKGEDEGACNYCKCKVKKIKDHYERLAEGRM